MISPEWKDKVGAGKAVKWPAPNSIGGKGNEGVAGQVKVVSGTIGYVEYAYALQNKMAYTLLKNKAGKFVKPSIEAFQAAANSADSKRVPGYYLMLNDEPGDQSSGQLPTPTYNPDLQTPDLTPPRPQPC